MGIFDRFKRQKSVLPEDVSQYYQPQKSSPKRPGIAVAIGLASLVVTLIIVLALFFVGRFAYQKIAGDDQKPAGQVQTQEDSSALPSESKPANPSPNNTQPAPAPSNSTSPAPTPRLGDTPAPLPRTGDEGM